MYVSGPVGSITHADSQAIDSQKIAVLGDSAGGHLVACLAVINKYDKLGEDLLVSGKPNAVIACNPIKDLLDEKWLPFVLVSPRSQELQCHAKIVMGYLIKLIDA